MGTLGLLIKSLFVAAVCGQDPVIAPWYEDHYAQLTEGIEGYLDQAPQSYRNSKLILTGEKAFPVWVDAFGDTRIAAAEYGQGRVIVSGRTQWLSKSNQSPSMAQFVANAIKWLTRGKENPNLACQRKTLFGHNCTITGVFDLPTDGSVDVFYLETEKVNNEDRAAHVKEFVSNGGALIISGQAYTWKRKADPGKTYVADFEGNLLTGEMGMLFAGKNSKVKDKDGVGLPVSMPVIPTPSLERNLLHAFPVIASGETDSIAYDTALNTFVRGTEVVLNNDTLNMEEYQTFYDQAWDLYKLSQDPIIFSRLSLLFYPIILAEDPINVDDLVIYNNVSTFPYDVPDDAERVTKTVTIGDTTRAYITEEYGDFSNKSKKEWMSTELYAAAGELIQVTLDESLIGNGYIQISANKDKLWKKIGGEKELKRPPLIVIKFPITSTSMTVASPYGGLIFIIVNADTTFGEAEVTIENAVESPYFELGVTSEEDWMNSIRYRKAPWMEMVAPGQISFIGPTSYALEVENMTRVLLHWDHIMKVAKEFAAFPEGSRPRAERVVVDVDISVGSMHSGYPIMGHLKSFRHALEAWNITSTWGIFHELGHNYQSRPQTMDHTGEVTNNWFSVVLSQVNDPEFRRRSLRVRDEAINDWYFKGKIWDDWEVWLALETYVILAEEFGWWESYQPLNKLYRDGEPLEGISVLDSWAQNYMAQVGYDLCDYFEWWTWELSNDTYALCETLPPLGKDLMEAYRHPPTTAECPDGWFAYGADKCFFVSEEKAVNWFDAEEMCMQLTLFEGHIASCFTPQEAYFLSNVVSKQYNKKESLYVGLNNIDDINNYVWFDGITADLERYPWPKKSEAPYHDGEHCIYFLKGKMYEGSCVQKSKYICQTGPSSCSDYLATIELKCPIGWTYWEGGCYFFERTKANWTDAAYECEQKEPGLSKLVQIETEQEQAYLADYLIRRQENQDYWIGVTCNRDMLWTDGEPVINPFWCEGKPNSPNSRIKTPLLRGDGRGFCWDDFYSSRTKAYICEMPSLVPDEENSGWNTSGSGQQEESGDGSGSGLEDDHSGSASGSGSGEEEIVET